MVVVVRLNDCNIRRSSMVITVLLGILIFLAWVIWVLVHKIMKIFVKTFSKKNVSQMNKYLANMKYFKMSNVQFSMGRGLLTDHCLSLIHISEPTRLGM